jgi:hypothetical protein
VVLQRFWGLRHRCPTGPTRTCSTLRLNDSRSVLFVRKPAGPGHMWRLPSAPQSSRQLLMAETVYTCCLEW